MQLDRVINIVGRKMAFLAPYFSYKMPFWGPVGMIKHKRKGRGG